MARFGRMLVWCLAVLWLPASLHCAVDRAGLMTEPPTCCDEPQDAAPLASACVDDCVPLDTATVELDRGGQGVAEPLWFTSLLAVLPELTAAVAAPQGEPPESAPPELKRTWHFVARAALPARAP